MKSSICIILSKLNLFNKNKKNKLYELFNEAALETLKDIEYSSKFIVIFDEDESFNIQNMIINALKDTGKKIIYNKKIYNDPTKFILKSSNILSFTINADVFMLTVNRESLKYIDMKKVDYFLINDINRNYSYRNNDEEDAIKKIVKSLDNKTKLIVNLDNPYTNSIKYLHQGKTIGYGIKSNEHIKGIDIKCPICHENLIYKSRYFLNFGNYICPNKDFETGIKSYEAKINDSTLEINSKKYQLNTLYYYDIYYLLGFYALSSNLNIPNKTIKKLIDNYKDSTVKKVNNDKNLNLYEVKNGNIILYQKYINYTSCLDSPILIGFSNISDTSSLDLSWLYEIDFTPLKNSKVYVWGAHQKDIEVRLSYDNIKVNLVKKLTDIKENDINVIMSKKEFNELGDLS